MPAAQPVVQQLLWHSSPSVHATLQQPVLVQISAFEQLAKLLAAVAAQEDHCTAFFVIPVLLVNAAALSAVITTLFADLNDHLLAVKQILMQY